MDATGSSPSRVLPTPRTSDANGVGLHGEGGMDLRTAVHLLPTPTAGLCNYEEDPETWEARRAAAAAKHGNNGIGTPLAIAVKLLPTPNGADGTGGKISSETRESGQKAQISLREAVTYPSSGETTSPPSAAGKPSTAPRPRLSPEFVGWMMGTPSCNECGREWTDSDCPHSATAFTSTWDGCSVRR